MDKNTPKIPNNRFLRLQWSDAFFNYVPAMQAYDAGTPLITEALTFVDVNPECPFTPSELITEFLARL